MTESSKIKFRPVHDLNKDKQHIRTHTNTGGNPTYHFSRTEVFWVDLHMYHPCLLATANLLLILSIPPGKTQILAGRSIFPQLLEGSAVLSYDSLIISCAVCCFNVSCRQNMSPVFFSGINTAGTATVTHTHTHLHQHVFQDTRGR